MSFDQSLPPLLAQLHELEFDYDDGEGIDFEPYQEFQSGEDTADWIKAWTGNADLTGSEFRIFGQDGSGGYAAFWVVRQGKPIADQPIVFFGSEGELGVVAADLGDYLWLLADGIGPLEAVEYGADEADPHAEFTAFASTHAPERKKTGAEVLARARAEFPDFEKNIRALCR